MSAHEIIYYKIKSIGIFTYTSISKSFKEILIILEILRLLTNLKYIDTCKFVYLDREVSTRLPSLPGQLLEDMKPTLL